MTITAISSIRNLGPAFQAACARAGIHSAEGLRDLGTDAAYARLLAAGEKPHFISYYVLEMALQGRPWNDCKGAEKDRLRARFDKIKSAHGASGHAFRPAFEAALDRLGVVPGAILKG